MDGWMNGWDVGLGKLYNFFFNLLYFYNFFEQCKWNIISRLFVDVCFSSQLYF